jgi:glucosamine-6-phosphate deaminase
MRIIRVSDYDEMSKKAARLIASQVLLKEDSVLGLATGSSPEGMYKELIKMYEDELVDFTDVTTFNLDEYVGLDKNNEHSYRYYMDSKFFNNVNMKEENINVPNGMSSNLEFECNAYEEKIAKYNGIDMQILGIGRNGHIGFNEPDIKFEAVTHVVKLDESTIEDNARFFSSKDLVPRAAVSVGIKTIMQARKIILLAYGEEKAEAIYGMLYGKIVPTLPASVLQLHPDVTIIVDSDASRLLDKNIDK